MVRDSRLIDVTCKNLSDEQPILRENTTSIHENHHLIFGPESEFARNKKWHLQILEESKHSIQEYYDEPSDFERHNFTPKNASGHDQMQDPSILQRASG